MFTVISVEKYDSIMLRVCRRSYEIVMLQHFNKPNHMNIFLFLFVLLLVYSLFMEFELNISTAYNFVWSGFLNNA